MASLTPHKRMIVVGHSFGGVALSLAMEKFPEKISVAVFATAMMPSIGSLPLIILERALEKWDDQVVNGPERPSTLVILRPKFMASNLYQCCSPEDHALATMLMRPAKRFEEDLSNEDMVSKEKYGPVSRVFIVCKEDLLMDESLQWWIISNSPPEEVMEIDGADHMVMLSKPKELCLCLVDIAKRYA